MGEDTGSWPVMQANVKYLSVDFHEELDRKYGQTLHENGGHVTITIRCDGERFPRWWECIIRYLGIGSTDR